MGYETMCPVCSTLKHVSVVEEEEVDISNKADKKNISKHYEETLGKIYGEPPKTNVCPDEVIKVLKDYLEDRNIDIRESMHFTLTLCWVT
ncbi:unnamed protein product [Ascophyllum nodosum]